MRNLSPESNEIVGLQPEYRGEDKIRAGFNDGVEATVDFSDWLDGPIFEPLKGPAYFARFFIDGGTIACPNSRAVFARRLRVSTLWTGSFAAPPRRRSHSRVEPL